MLPNKYVIIWDGLPVGVDQSSGGYPFKTKDANLVRYWRDLVEAEKYISIFSSYNYNWEIKEIQFRLV